MAELFAKLPNMTPVKAIAIGYDGTNMQIIKCDSAGRIQVISTDLNPLAIYQASEEDAAGDPQYFGFLDTGSEWYILRRAISTGQMRFCKGSASYTAAWTNRALQSFDYYNNVF